MEISIIENWQIPLLMTFLAGLATILGGFITFFVNKNNMKVLSLGLGFSAGVMIFVSLTEIMDSAKELLRSYFPNNYAWMVFLGFIVVSWMMFFSNLFKLDKAYFPA